MGPCGRGGVGKPGSLSSNYGRLVHYGKSTPVSRRPFERRKQTFAAWGNDIKHNRDTASSARLTLQYIASVARRCMQLHLSCCDARLAFPGASSGCAYSATARFCACGSDWAYARNHTLSAYDDCLLTTSTIILVLRTRGSSPRYPGQPPDAHKILTVV
jgi:hypothetical protein